MMDTLLHVEGLYAYGVEVNRMAVLLSNLMKGYKAGDTSTILWECIMDVVRGMALAMNERWSI